MKATSLFKDQRDVIGIIFFLMVYASIQTYFNLNIALGADEFVFLRHIYDYTHLIPYKDFAPYKSTIGYYLLSLPMFIANNLFDPQLYIKHELTFLNCLGFLFIYHYWRKQYLVLAIIMAFFVLSFNQLFLIYSTDIRVDMLTVWASLFAIIFAQHHRPMLAGTTMALAFLISQKALWFFMACNGAFILNHLFINKKHFTYRECFRFNLFFLLILGIYIFCWGMASSFQIVLHSLFYEAYIQASITYFESAYLLCWVIVINHGPFLFLMTPYFFALFKRSKFISSEDYFLVFTATSSLIFYLAYKQPFPYNFVFNFPGFLIILTILLDYGFKQNINPLTFNFFDAYALTSFILALSYILYILPLPYSSYLIILFPVCLECVFYLSNKNYLQPAIATLLFLVFLNFAILYPISENIRVLKKVDKTYQQQSLEIADWLLKFYDGNYIAGVPFIFYNDQPISGMKNLIGPAIDYLYQPQSSLLPLFLNSIYLTPTHTEAVIQSMQKNKIILYINNYRMRSLPADLTNFLKDNYRHYQGSIYLYAPKLRPNKNQVNLKFSGAYKITSPPQSKVFINGKKINIDHPLYLIKGIYHYQTDKGFRLNLNPQLPPSLLGYDKKEDYYRILKPVMS